MEFLTTELRDKPIIGMISGVGAWMIHQIHMTTTSGFFSDNNPIWDVLSKFGILMGILIAMLTFALKLKEVYKEFIDKTK